MASDDGDMGDVLLLVHQVPLEMEEGPTPRLVNILPPLHHAPPPPPPPPFRSPPPPQAAASAEHRISFRGWLGIPRQWDDWVAKLRPVHGRLWRHLGIHDAVLASTLRIKRDASAVLHLASFWCPATSTFAFPWGEATVTLQDVALLAGFPALGAPARGPLPPQWRPDEAALNGVRLGFNRSACKKAHHSAWVKHFLTDDGTADPVFEHAAFLALWLTRFVLPGHPESTMRQSVFPIAVRLARGERVALGPAVLASIYRDLREIKAFLGAAGAAAATTAGDASMISSLSVYSPLYIVQLWMWERFPALRPTKVNTLVDGDPLAARWHDLSRKLNPMQMREGLNRGYNFVWQPYASSMEHTGWVHSSDLAGNDELMSLAHFLHPCELVGMDCIELYLPHRVTRQFGLDQDVPGDVHCANQDWAIAWRTYQLEGKNMAFFIPHSDPGITARYAQWWRQQLLPSHVDAAAANAPVEWKTSKRKVKKTPAAMEAEAEKERRTKKPRVSPTSDKKRKLEELYDAKLSDWLPTARNEISDRTSEMGSEEALLPNVGTTNDDIVLLIPRKQTTTAPVTALMNNVMTPALGERGNFMVDEPADIPSAPEAGIPATLEEEIVKIPVVTSLDIPDEPEEGATAQIEEQKEADDIMLIMPMKQTPTATATALMDNDTTSVLGERGNFMTDEPPDIPSEPAAGVTATLEEEIVNIPMVTSLDIPDKPEGATALMEEQKEADDIVLLMPMKQTPTATVTALMDNDTTSVLGERGNFMIDEPPDIPSEPAAGVTATLEEEIVKIPVVISLDIPDKLEGATALMEEQKEADDIVLLMPRKQTTTAPITAVMDNDVMIPALGETGNFMVDEPADIPSEPEAGVPATLEEEIVKIPVVISLDIPDKPEEGATAVMEEQKEANSVSDRSEEASAPVIEEVEKKITSVSDRSGEASALVIEEVEEKVAIEGAIGVTGMNPSGNNTAIVMEADERNAVPKEFGRAAEEAIEAVPQSQHEIDAGVMNNSHDAVALPEEAFPVQPTNNSGGCPVVSCIMEDSKVAGDSGKNDYGKFCDFVEEHREIPSVEEIAGENSHMGEKVRKEISHESPQLETVECVQDSVLMETEYDVEQKIVHSAVEDVATGYDVEQKIVHSAVEDVVTSNSMTPALLGVSEPENAELNKHPYLANKDAEDIPMEVAQGEEAQMEQISTAKGGAKEYEEFSEVNHMGTTDAKLHLHLNYEVHEKIDEVECKGVDGTMRLTGRDSDKKLGDVPEVGYQEDENIRRLIVNTSYCKPSEVSQVEPAKLEDSKDLMEEDTDKSENVPGLECTGLEETHGDLMEEGTNNKSENLPKFENTGLGGTRGPVDDTNGRLKEIHDANAELENHYMCESDIDRSEDIMQIYPLTQDEDRWLAKEETEDNTTKVQEVNYGQLRNKVPIQEDSKEKPCANSKDLSENLVDQSREVDKLKQEGEGCQVLMEKDMENTSDAFVPEQTEDGYGKSLIETSINKQSEIALVKQLDGQIERLTRTGTEEIHGETNDKDVVEDSSNSINAEMPCSSASLHLKEDKMEFFHEDKIEEPCVQDVELINQREPSSDATAMEIEAVALEQDNRIISKNMEATTVEGSHTLDSGLNSDLANVDETHAVWEIKNQEILDVDMQVAMDERQDLQAVTGNDKRNMSEDTGTSVCGEYQINSTGTDDVKSTKGLQNQECLDQTEQLAREERHNLGTITENNEMNMLEDADVLVCGQYQNDPTHTKVEPSKGIQNQELLNNKEDQVMDERVECGATDGIGVSYEEACNLGGDGVHTCGVAVDVSDPVQNKEACNTDELQASEDKQHHGVGHTNEKNILEDTSMIDTGELKSDSTVMEVSMAGLREGTLSQCASSLEKVSTVADSSQSHEEAVQEKHDQGVADENINRSSTDIDALECEGVNPDVAMKMFHGTILTTEAVNVAGSKISSENKQKEAPFEEHSITEVEGCESNAARKEPEGALPQEPGNLVKTKQESVENVTEMSIFRENDKASGKHETSAGFIIAPSNMDERGENDIEWPDESAKGCGRLTSDSVNTVRSIKFVKSSSEEVKRTQNTRSMYLKDIKESSGRIRAEPSNRVQSTSVGHYSRHAVQDLISSCKEIKVPSRDSARDFGRDRALELVVASPQEETSRWRQEQYALQILEDVQNSRMAEKSRLEMEIRVLKSQVSSMEKQVMNLDHFSEVKSRSSLNQQMLHLHKPSF